MRVAHNNNLLEDLLKVPLHLFLAGNATLWFPFFDSFLS